MRFRLILPLLLSHLSGLVSGVPAQTPAALTPTSVLASDDLRSDLAALRDAFTRLHPGLYRYTTPRELAARFDSVDRYFSRDRTLGEAFVALTRLTATIECGHTYPNFYNQPDAIAAALFDGRNKVPFEFRWMGGRMVVTTDRTVGTVLPRGTEVVAIDGVRTDSILRALMPLARADGSNDGKRVAYLEVTAIDRYEAFDVLYPLVFAVHDTMFTLTVRRPGDSSRSTVRVASLTSAQRLATRRITERAETSDPVWQYDERDGVGVLTMPTWSLYDSKWDWRRWTDSLMAELVRRGVRDLVLDVRANEGGVDAGNAILAHLIDKPLSLPPYRHFVRYRAVPSDLRPILKTWDAAFFDWGVAAEGPATNGFYRLRKWDSDTSGAHVVMPTAPRFTGRVWVLVGPVNSSATFQFALAVQRTRLGTLVGSTTGGNLRGINGSAFFFVRLPRTGLEVDLPLVAAMPPGPERDAGVEPDIRTRLTVADVARGVDVDLSAVRSRIRLLDARLPEQRRTPR